jgi:rhodanese-related sulfurtransferase
MITADITAEELKERLAKGETPVIIDVREDWEHQESKIENAKNIPLGTLPERVDELEEYRDQEVIVHCKSGMRSTSAKAFLQQQGFKQVRNLLGGITAYQG